MLLVGLGGAGLVANLALAALLLLKQQLLRDWGRGLLLHQDWNNLKY